MIRSHASSDTRVDRAVTRADADAVVENVDSTKQVLSATDGSSRTASTVGDVGDVNVRAAAIATDHLGGLADGNGVHVHEEHLGACCGEADRRRPSISDREPRGLTGADDDGRLPRVGPAPDADAHPDQPCIESTDTVGSARAVMQVDDSVR